MTDFGLSGKIGKRRKQGGTPIYANERIFNGDQYGIDEYSYLRLHLYLCLDWEDFIQLNCFPIEDDAILKIIQNGIKSFDLINEILKELKYGKNAGFYNLSSCSKVKISRQDLISSGIPADWFLDSLPLGHRDTIQSEYFKLQNIK